jgi:hypothetical protein
MTQDGILAAVILGTPLAYVAMRLWARWAERRAMPDVMESIVGDWPHQYRPQSETEGE